MGEAAGLVTVDNMVITCDRRDRYIAQVISSSDSGVWEGEVHVSWVYRILISGVETVRVRPADRFPRQSQPHTPH